VEERFLDGYFRDHFGGKTVLEIGCGTGYFTARMAGHARRALGGDYNPEYVEIARRTWPAEQYPNLEFQVGDIVHLGTGASEFARSTYDFVILIDTFLFLFDTTYQGALHENRHAIMRHLRRLVKPGGLLLLHDPHPFWLTPWLGTAEQPFGI